MGLVGDYGKAFALNRSQLTNGLERTRKRLDRANDDLFVSRQCVGQFGTLATLFPFDRRNDTAGSLKTINRFLQLAIDDTSVRNHQYRIEDFLARGIMKIGQKVSGPSDRVGFA